MLTADGMAHATPSPESWEKCTMMRAASAARIFLPVGPSIGRRGGV